MMIWLTEVRTGRTVGINPVDIVKVLELEDYLDAREGAPNTWSQPPPEGDLNRQVLHGCGAYVILRGVSPDHSVEQTPEDIRALLTVLQAQLVLEEVLAPRVAP